MVTYLAITFIQLFYICFSIIIIIINIIYLATLFKAKVAFPYMVPMATVK